MKLKNSFWDNLDDKDVHLHSRMYKSLWNITLLSCILSLKQVITHLLSLFCKLFDLLFNLSNSPKCLEAERYSSLKSQTVPCHFESFDCGVEVWYIICELVQFFACFYGLFWRKVCSNLSLRGNFSTLWASIIVSCLSPATSWRTAVISHSSRRHPIHRHTVQNYLINFSHFDVSMRLLKYEYWSRLHSHNPSLWSDI